MTSPRSEPVFFVRIGAPASKALTGPVPQTPKVRALADKLKTATKTYETEITKFGAEESSTPEQQRLYISVVSAYRKAKRDYEQACLEARRAAAPKLPPVPDTVADISESVQALEFEEGEKKADQLTLTLRNSDLSYFDSPLFEKGTSLIVAWGYAGNLTPPREVVVQSVKGGLTLKVIAHAKSVLMNKRTRVRSFDAKTRSEVVRQLAEENGYGALQQDIEETAVRYGVLSQAAQTDAQFIKRLADQEGFEFYVDFDGLHWHRRRFSQKPVRLLTYYLPPNVGDIITFNIDNDVTAKPAAIRVKGKDPVTKKGFTVTANNDATQRDTLATTTEMVDEQTGAKTTVFREMASSETRPTSETTPAGAKTEADAIFRRTQQTAVELSMTLVGDPSLVAKTIVEVQGLGKRLSGKYYLATVKQTISPSGYVMHVTAKTDGTQQGATKSNGKLNPHAAPPADRATSGELTPVEVVDPQTGAKHTIFRDTRGRDDGAKAPPKEATP